MQVSDLERLATDLQRLRDRLAATSQPADKPLASYDPLVQAAKECEFMLPSPVNVRTLTETVDRKIENVAVLLERARRHEDLPDVAQVAAEQEYTLTREDYLMNKQDQESQETMRQQR